MKSDLDEVIELLEAEKSALELAVKGSVEELEYLNAHYQTNALFKLNVRLNILNKLRDPFYHQKQDIERIIKMHEDFYIGKLSSDMDSYYLQIIDSEKEKLLNLNSNEPISLYDDQNIDDALFSLWAGAHIGFILYLNLKDNLGITFEATGTDFIEISISVKSALNVEYFFSDEEEDVPLNKFTGLGFSLNCPGNKLVYKYDASEFKDAIAVKILLSRLIYDVFTYVDIDNPASLVYF